MGIYEYMWEHNTRVHTLIFNEGAGFRAVLLTDWHHQLKEFKKKEKKRRLIDFTYM